MKKIELLPHQLQALDLTKDNTNCGYFLDMGLGKTFVGSEKARLIDNQLLIIVCPKSMISTWEDHIKTFYPDWNIIKTSKNSSGEIVADKKQVIIINYDLIWRRKFFEDLRDYTLILDESSYIKNETSKRTKFILRMKPSNVILLSGTPCGGKYEELWTQCRLLGWGISKDEFYKQFIITKKLDVGGFKVPIVVGYRNVDRLKRKLRDHGGVFMKTDDVFTLPDQINHFVTVKPSKELKTFMKDSYVRINEVELMGDTTLNNILYQRQLCSVYSKNKLDKLIDMLQSTNDRLIIFYNFADEFKNISNVCNKLNKPVSFVNGGGKDLANYETMDNSVTLIQYQAGSMGLNLQKANKIIYFSLTLSSEMYEQSRKRTNRIGQSNTCHYYHLLVENSIEEKIISTLQKRKDFNSKLFENQK